MQSKIQTIQIQLLQVTHRIPWNLISGTGIYPLKQEVQAILDLAPPSNVMQARLQPGLASYYRKFIPMFGLIVSPITSLTKNIPFVWTVACQTAHDTITMLLLIVPY